MIDATDWLNSLSKTDAIAFADLHGIDIGQNSVQLRADWQEILLMREKMKIYEFHLAFESIERNNFSYEGQEILFDYFGARDENRAPDIEKICCDFSEDDNSAIAEQYDIDVEGMDENDCFKAVYKYLSERTVVVGSTCDGRIIYANY